MDEIVKVYIKHARYDDAASYLLMRLKNTNVSRLREVCVKHDIARCFFLVGSFEKAMQFANEALLTAESLENDRWKMNAKILIAQIHSKNMKILEAYEYYSSATELAKKLNDSRTSEIITYAINALKIYGEPQEEKDITDKDNFE